MKSRKSDTKFVRAYDRAMLRSAFVSLFWAIITERRKKGTYTLLELAKQLGTNKGAVSRWFKGEPNWTVGTIANIANALNVELRIEAVDRVSGEVFTPAGIQVHKQYQEVTSATPSIEVTSAISPIREFRVTSVRGPAPESIISLAA
jgi:transcriptional regulator with XRE-family HTH domain